MLRACPRRPIRARGRAGSSPTSPRSSDPAGVGRPDVNRRDLESTGRRAAASRPSDGRRNVGRRGGRSELLRRSKSRSRLAGRRGGVRTRAWRIRIASNRIPAQARAENTGLFEGSPHASPRTVPSCLRRRLGRRRGRGCRCHRTRGRARDHLLGPPALAERRNRGPVTRRRREPDRCRLVGRFSSAHPTPGEVSD